MEHFLRHRAALAWRIFRQRANEMVRPPVHVVRRHARPHRPHPPAAFRRVHVQRLPHRGGQPLDIVRIHDHRLLQFVSGPCELAQHEDPFIVHLRGDVLLGDQVHAVAQRRDEHDAGGAIQGGKLLDIYVLVKVVDGDRRQRPIRSVDVSDQFFHLAPEILITGHRFSGWNGDLHQPDAIAQRRVVAEK
jgi:hypothetical protein